MKKMNLNKTILFFGVPGISMHLIFIHLYPSMIITGINEFWATFLSSWTIPMLMAIVIIIMWKSSNIKLKEYIFIRKLKKKELLIVICAFFATQAFETLLSPTRTFLSQFSAFQAPEVFPSLFKPDFELSLPATEWMGMHIQGEWLPFVLWGLWLVINIGVEEFLWRGYALPRMELHFGKWAWLVNGLCWNILFHFVMRWSVIGMLPISIIVPYLSQKYKSLWPGVIIHGTGNFLVFIILIMSY